MLTGYFPAQWKVAKIILHLKPETQWTYDLLADKLFTHSIQSLRGAHLTPPPTNYWKP
jgi:hypothetical protein